MLQSYGYIAKMLEGYPKTEERAKLLVSSSKKLDLKSLPKMYPKTRKNLDMVQGLGR
jgi:hypothetical protein